MKRINEDAAEAFMAGKRFYRANTSVVVMKDAVMMKLHTNPIAYRRLSDGSLWVSLAGWPTVTTRARLNAIPGVSVTQRRHVQYLNGVEMDERAWEEVR